MSVFWYEQAVADVRVEDDWLSRNELARLVELRVPKRREDWRLGRWTAKHAVTSLLDLPSDPSALVAIEIRPADSGAPEVFLHGSPAPVSISLTHRDGLGACAIAAAGTILGCDLEVVEPRCDAFITDYFSAEEQALIMRAPDDERFRLLALLWSAKESMLKALREGLRLDPRAIEVHLSESFAGCTSSEADVWHPLFARSAKETLQGWWQYSGDVVRTLICEPVCASPPIFRAIHMGTQIPFPTLEASA